MREGESVRRSWRNFPFVVAIFCLERWQGKALGGGAHFALMQRLGLGGGLVERGEESLLDRCLVFLEKLGIKAYGAHLAVSVDDDLDCAATVGDFDSLAGEGGLGLLNALLHALGLFQDFSDSGHGDEKFLSCFELKRKDVFAEENTEQAGQARGPGR